MRPWLFVNWSSVSARFRALMWIVAIVLAGVVVVHLVPASTAVHH
jgi:hypothetical protein